MPTVDKRKRTSKIQRKRKNNVKHKSNENAGHSGILKMTSKQ